MLRPAMSILLLSATICTAQVGWSLSGKVVDAEEGNGLNTVEVSLAQAGLRTTTAKNGTWTLGGILAVRARADHSRSTENFLHLVDGRLRLRLGGTDIQGRRLEGIPDRLPASVASRSSEIVQDTLVYSRDGFVQKRVPVSSSILSGILDSLRRVRYEGWIDSSHSNGFKPDTTDVFADTLRKITFKFAKSSWDSMMKVMTDTCGRFGGGRITCGAGGLDLVRDGATIWVPADLHTDGQVWKNIAIRLKGNASLQTAWNKGSYSLPFRINMDKFEDDYPETKNQRFHGYKKLTFYTADQDSSSVRAAIASEIFRESGVACPISVPVQLFLDRGDGTTLDLGVYEMAEVPDSPMLNRFFGNDTGHLYKPESNFQRFTQTEWYDEDFETDFADVKALIAAVNATNRTSDSAAWHRQLESVIDVDGFLKWLAVNTAVYNWDTYGGLAHNYFLYNDDGRFRWIAYDIAFSFNFAFKYLSRTSIWYDWTAGPFGSSPANFPLIKNLLADKTYCETYRAHMVGAIAPDGPASDANYKAKVDRYAAMVAPFPAASKSVKGIRDVMATRIAEIQKSLAAKTCPIR